MVYVISKDGQPLMPTERHGKVRRLLRDNKAKVVKRCPFTIQLLYDTTTIVQEVKVIYNGKIGFVSARRRSGSYRIRDIFWNSLSEGVTFRKLKFVESRQYYLCDKIKVS